MANYILPEGLDHRMPQRTIGIIFAHFHCQQPPNDKFPFESLSAFIVGTGLEGLEHPFCS
eukprot:scaffold399656_cov33-Prasinocladus_malaysianus.AAC.1